MQERIVDEQDLLERFYKADCGVINEYSSNIEKDTKELHALVRDYANRRGLSSAFVVDPSWWDTD